MNCTRCIIDPCYLHVCWLRYIPWLSKKILILLTYIQNNLFYNCYIFILVVFIFLITLKIMWLTSGRASGRKTLLQYSSLTPLERECYEGEVQPYRKTDYKPIIYIYITLKMFFILPATFDNFTRTSTQQGVSFFNTPSLMLFSTLSYLRQSSSVRSKDAECINVALIGQFMQHALIFWSL